MALPARTPWFTTICLSSVAEPKRTEVSFHTRPGGPICSDEHSAPHCNIPFCWRHAFLMWTTVSWILQRGTSSLRSEIDLPGDWQDHRGASGFPDWMNAPRILREIRRRDLAIVCRNAPWATCRGQRSNCPSIRRTACRPLQTCAPAFPIGSGAKRAIDPGTDVIRKKSRHPIY